MSESFEKVISLSHVDVLQSDNLILKDVNYSLSKGEFNYLIGETGSGKSSLLRALYADVYIENGEAQVVGYDLMRIKDKQIPYLRRKLGIVFQDFQLLFDRDIAENLKFVMRATDWRDNKAMDRRVEELLDIVGLQHQSYKKPNQLSGGQQQRLSIARALVNNPTLILADEPTGNLDPEASAQIMELLFKLCEDDGMAVLMATHNYALFDTFPATIYKCNDLRLFPYRV